jgi:putative Holliday junction resolvase
VRNGVRLGVDAGKARVGLALSDPSGILATPLVTLARTDAGLISKIASEVKERAVIEVIVGLPLNLAGLHTPSTEDAVALAREIADAIAVPVRLLDERLTTVSAHSALRATGKKERGTRSVIDQVAAVMVLQQALDMERSSDKPAGIALEDI